VNLSGGQIHGVSSTQASVLGSQDGFFDRYILIREVAL
jgi:hypothetical protein